jgi:hypothetical protein
MNRRFRLLLTMSLTLGLVAIGAPAAADDCIPDNPEWFCGALCLQNFCWYDTTVSNKLCIQIPGGCGAMDDHHCCTDGGGLF